MVDHYFDATVLLAACRVVGTIGVGVGGGGPRLAVTLHLGGFGHGGVQVARDEFGTRTGQAWGGGAILEFALTTRLALTGRVDYTIARTSPENQAWASTSMLTAGLAIY